MRTKYHLQGPICPPRIQGLPIEQLISRVLASPSGPRVLVLADPSDLELAAGFLDLGASGCYLKSDRPGELLRGIRAVAERRPDLLCVEVDRPAWESGDLEKAPVEVRATLAELARSSEITLVPIGRGGRDWTESGVTPPTMGPLAPLRRRLFELLDGLTSRLMRAAGRPRLVNSALVEHLCGGLCDLQARLADPEAREAWEARNRELLEGILWIVRRDPGRRVLVALDCRRKHWLGRQLRSTPDVELVDYWRL